MAGYREVAIEDKVVDQTAGPIVVEPLYDASRHHDRVGARLAVVRQREHVVLYIGHGRQRAGRRVVGVPGAVERAACGLALFTTANTTKPGHKTGRASVLSQCSSLPTSRLRLPTNHWPLHPRAACVRHIRPTRQAYRQSELLVSRRRREHLCNGSPAGLLRRGRPLIQEIAVHIVDPGCESLEKGLKISVHPGVRHLARFTCKRSNKSGKVVSS